MTDNRNTILAVILSGLVLLGWQYFFNIPQMEKQRAAQLAQRPDDQARAGGGEHGRPADRRRACAVRHYTGGQRTGGQSAEFGGTR